MKLSLTDLQAVTGGQIEMQSHLADLSVNSVIIDSRTVSDYKTCLFVAIKGPRHDGHDYIAELYRKGVRLFLVNQSADLHYQSFDKGVFIVVPDSIRALQNIAGWYRKQFQIPVIAITGSNGKTVVKEWLYDLLRTSCSIVRSPGSFNSQVGVPLSVLKLEADHELAIFEAGISKPGEMEKLAQVVHPTVGILTNIGDAHQENFKSLEEKLEQKLQLFSSCELIIYSDHSPIVQSSVLHRFGSLQDKRLFFWSTKDREADLFVQYFTKAAKTKLKYCHCGITKELTVPFSDSASLENLTHCLAYLIATNSESEEVSIRFGQLHPLAMRLEIKEGIKGCTLINDYYNSDINSLEIALQFQSRQPIPSGTKKVLILSDLQESGYSDKELVDELIYLLRLHKIDFFIGVGENLVRNKNCFPEDSAFFDHTADLLRGISDLHLQNSLILLKGARKFRFEQLSTILQQQAHLTRLEINLNTLVDNLNAYKALLKPTTKIVAMVKAFSYGSGTVEVARALEIQGIDYLAVAVADEGVELREAGIRSSVIVMNPEPHSYELMIANRLEPNIYALDELKAFKNAAARMAEIDYPIHLKLDTGMHRLGFSSKNELESVITELRGNDVLKLVSVFSHLAVSDEPSQDAFTLEQFRRFRELTDFISQSCNCLFLRHILNSAGIERFSAQQMEMVRLGIGLYGISLSGTVDVHSVASWKTVISQLKVVDKGETIGYGRRGVADQQKLIAVLPVGYADGYSRRFGNGKGKVWINGYLAPVIGNVCMDMVMIDVSGMPLKVGDEVELMGTHISLEQLAEWEETIPYEILTSISRRVKRIYIQE